MKINVKRRNMKKSKFLEKGRSFLQERNQKELFQHKNKGERAHITLRKEIQKIYERKKENI